MKVFGLSGGCFPLFFSEMGMMNGHFCEHMFLEISCCWTQKQNGLASGPWSLLSGGVYAFWNCFHSVSESGEREM